jgi:hypothetical protein
MHKSKLRIKDFSSSRLIRAMCAGPSRILLIVAGWQCRQVRQYRADDETLADTDERLQFDCAPCALVRWR